MDIAFGASIIAAFFAGMVALFAPCCITVLLPAYVASAAREKRNILKMTFVFFTGIAVILLPIGMGAAGLAQLFQKYHKEMYILGGLLMIFLGTLALLGKSITMIPLPKKMMPRLDGGDAQHQNKYGAGQAKSVFALGIFSGAATSCCAPVLAGAITLAVISGVFWKALIVTFAYVFGMTFPLFAGAYFYDRFHIEKSAVVRGRTFQLKLCGRVFALHSTNLIAGIVFLLTGALLVYLALSGNAFWAPFFQAKIGAMLNQWSERILQGVRVLPDFIWGIIILGIFFFLVYPVRNSISNGVYRVFSRKKDSQE